jgi:hypothetical protein
MKAKLLKVGMGSAAVGGTAFAAAEYNETTIAEMVMRGIELILGIVFIFI